MNKQISPEMVLEALPEIEWIESEQLRRQVVQVWIVLWTKSNWGRLEDLPVSEHLLNYSHVTHNRSVIHLARHAADVFEMFHGVKCDRDVLYAAVLLQDASKLLEYAPSDNGQAAKTPEGKILEHPIMVIHEMLTIGLPMEVIDIVWHHNPEARRFPSQLEGLILYYCDQMDVSALGGHRWKREIFTRR